MEAATLFMTYRGIHVRSLTVTVLPRFKGRKDRLSEAKSIHRVKLNPSLQPSLEESVTLDPEVVTYSLAQNVLIYSRGSIYFPTMGWW